MDAFERAAWLVERGCVPFGIERPGRLVPGWGCPGRVTFLQFRPLGNENVDAAAVTDRAWVYMLGYREAA